MNIIISKSIIVIILAGAILGASSFVIWQTLIQKRTQLVLNDFSIWDRARGHNLLWASVSMKDPEGKLVTGLSLKDFSLSEALINSTGNVIQELPIILKDYTLNEPNSYYQFYGDGFWERSVTSEKLDIIFLVDMTGSMEDEMPGIHSELHEFVNRLLSEHVDFRISIVKYEGSTEGNSPAEEYNSWAFTMPFRGVMEAEEIHQWLDNVQLTGGEWWDPAASYDQMMLAVSEFDFREDARKVIVIITDSPAKSVYGTFWYTIDCSAATLSAVELFLKDKGIEVLYSQPEKLEHLEGYFDANINPKAMAGFETIGTRISWPFQQEDINIKSGQIIESQYFFAWESQLKLPDKPYNYTVRVTIKAADPSRPGESVECVFSYVPYKQTARFMANVYDEEGNPIDDVSVHFYREMGDRKICVRSHEKPKNGLIMIDDMPIGSYHVIAHASGVPFYTYETLRYKGSYRIEVPAKGLNLTLRIETGDREMELAKARGLLKDLEENWSAPDNPFKAFVVDAEKWLNELEADGITWREMVAIKRFYVALSGYANINEYAQREAADAAKDLQEIIRDISEIFKQLNEFEKARKMSFEEILTIAIIELAYDILTSGEFTIAKEAVEYGLALLEVYIKNELIPDLIDKVLEQILDEPYKPIVSAMINAYIKGDFDDEQLIKKITEDTYNLILKKYYIEKTNASLYAILVYAKNYEPQGEIDDWERGMTDDFRNYRDIIDSVQEKAWEALAAQEAIENWAEGLESLVDILESIAEPLDTLGFFYPPFKDEAKAVRGLIKALDEIQIIPKAIELGLEIDCIYTLGNKAEFLPQAAFGET